jgi:hypothetical protein
MQITLSERERELLEKAQYTEIAFDVTSSIFSVSGEGRTYRTEIMFLHKPDAKGGVHFYNSRARETEFKAKYPNLFEECLSEIYRKGVPQVGGGTMEISVKLSEEAKVQRDFAMIEAIDADIKATTVSLEKRKQVFEKQAARRKKAAA